MMSKLSKRGAPRSNFSCLRDYIRNRCGDARAVDYLAARQLGFLLRLVKNKGEKSV